MGMSKKLLLYMLAGALIGNIAAMIISPAILVWYETPGDPGALCNCVTTVRTTISQFIRGQLLGALAGAVLLLLIGVVRGKSQRPPSEQSPAGGGTSNVVAPPRG